MMNEHENMLKEYTKQFAKELPVLRKMNNLTQKDLGEIIGVSRQTITNIESGKTNIKLTLFFAMMFVFSLDKDTCEYINRIDIPYDELKMWLKQKKNVRLRK